MVRIRVFVCLVVLTILCVPVSESRADEWGEFVVPAGEAVKVGLGTMLSGGYATMGIDIKNAVEMAVKEKKEIMGHPLELEAEDDQCEGAPSVAIAEKFCNDPRIVGVIGYMCSGGSIPASDIHQKYKLVMISPSSTGLEVTKRGISVFFRTCWNDKIQGTAAAEFAVKKGWTRVAVVHDKSAYGQGLADEFKRYIEKHGGQVVSYEGLTRGDKDFSPVLTKIKIFRPQLVYFGGMSAEGALLVRQMRRIGMKAVFLSDDGCYAEKSFIQGAGKASTGAYITYAKVPKGEKFSKWVARFEAKYGPKQTFSPQAYDATGILLTAIEKVAQKGENGELLIGRKALRDAVRNIEYDGVTGHITFDEVGDRTGSVVAVNVVACEHGKCFFKEVTD